MPIYGYRCKQCGNETEVLQSISDPPLRTCSECMGPLEKMLYPVGVIFKGSGFYTTDYRASSKGGENGSSGGGEKAGPGSKSSGSESKSEGSKADSGSSSSGSKDSTGSSGSSDKPARSEKSGQE